MILGQHSAQTNLTKLPANPNPSPDSNLKTSIITIIDWDYWKNSTKYLDPEVTMVFSPILSARSARSLMYSSPTHAREGRRACSSKGFPSPPSRMMYSMPKWLCKLSTLSRNQFVALGLVMLSFTLYFLFHWVNRGTLWKRNNNAQVSIWVKNKEYQ